MIPNPDTEIVTLEHVLPENPGKNWGKIDPEVAQAFYRRIGNLALLERPINEEIGNRSFSVKKPFLESAPFSLTRAVAKYSDWGPDEISERQKMLGELAVATWPLRP